MLCELMLEQKCTVKVFEAFFLYFAAKFAKHTWKTPKASPWKSKTLKNQRIGHRSTSGGQPFNYPRFNRATRRWQVKINKAGRRISAADRPLTTTHPPLFPPPPLSELSPKPLLHKLSWHLIICRDQASVEITWLSEPGGQTGLPALIAQHPRLKVISENIKKPNVRWLRLLACDFVDI